MQNSETWTWGHLCEGHCGLSPDGLLSQGSGGDRGLTSQHKATCCTLVWNGYGAGDTLTS